LPLLLTEGFHQRNLLLPLIAKVTSANVAARFRLPPTKGKLRVGADADLAIVALDESFEVKADDLLYRHAQTPYLGRRLTGKVVQTILRGVTVAKHGKIVGNPIGKLVCPEPGIK